MHSSPLWLLQVREAAKRSVLMESGLGPNMLPREMVGLKGFENAVIAAASTALDDWKAEAHKGEEKLRCMQLHGLLARPGMLQNLCCSWRRARGKGPGAACFAANKRRGGGGSAASRQHSTAADGRLRAAAV